MNDIVQYHGTAIATASEVVAQTLRVQEVMKAVMKPDIHYGVIPGTKKNTLYKPGAEILAATFHIAPTYEVVEDRFDDGVRYRVTCIGVHQGTGVVVAHGLGSCSSMEEKYKWRRTYSAKEFEAASVDRKRIEYGWDKQKRAECEIKQIRVETADIENTLLKMACKRAFIAMVLSAVGASDVFAQDLEDLSKKVVDMMVDEDTGEVTKKEPVKTPQAKSGNGSGAHGAAEDTGNADATPASDGMLTFLRKALEKAALSEADCLKKFDLTQLAGMSVAQANAAIAWTRNPAG
jgi:hypothetical protein